jgi:hypothetical protein
MRATTLLLAAVLLLGVTRRAIAETHDGDIGVAVVVLGVPYVGITGAFAVKDLTGSTKSMNYGVGEVLWNAPFLALWTHYIISDATDRLSSHSGLPAASVFATVHAALLAHGIYTIVQNKRRKSDAPTRNQTPAGAMQIGPVTAVVAPAAMSDGAGLGFAGTF